jgi:hypothetical protein
MKNINLKTNGAIAVAILMIVIFLQISVSAQETESVDQNTGNLRETENTLNRDDGKLVGTWDVQVTLRNCQTGAALRTFPSATTFMLGGTMLDSTSGIPQALKTPGHGVWNQIERNTYRFKFKSFNFDAAGNFTGWTIISHEAQLNRQANEVESAGTAEVYAPNGTLVFSGCSTTTATRFE